MGLKKKTKKPVIWQDITPAKRVNSKAARQHKKIIEINIHLPHFFSTPKFLRFKKKVSKIPKAIWILTLVIVILGAAYLLIGSRTTNNSQKNGPDFTGETPNVQTDSDSSVPKYSTITPNGEDISQLGGWTRSSPLTTNAVFAYSDRISGVSIKVNQQPVPTDFSDDTDNQVEKLAIGLNANEKITVGGILVHIGSSKEGNQSVIFVKNKLLILITSRTKITNDQWANYINSLQ